LPPIADPALWRRFVGNSINTAGPVAGRIFDETWHGKEFHGDKIMASISIDLFNEYLLPHSWRNNLLRALCSNEYQKQMARALGLPNYLLVGPLGKKGSSDSLEIVKLFPKFGADFIDIFLNSTKRSSVYIYKMFCGSLPG
jgi:hypothetical protein